MTGPHRFQFTPLREGRPDKYYITHERYISIHAPPRGATRSTWRSTRSLKFQFTPLREGRLRGHSFLFARLKNFNSRPSARGDSAGGLPAAPAVYFNSRPSARGDLPFCVLFSFVLYFNSRPSARGDGIRERAAAPTENFNSRPSARGDCNCRKSRRWNHISIHAPPRGATAGRGRAVSHDSISIHAPPRGATDRRYHTRRALMISIHAPPRGATLLPVYAARGLYFNSRPSARGDTTMTTPIMRRRFQFTPLREGRQLRRI